MFVRSSDQARSRTTIGAHRLAPPARPPRESARRRCQQHHAPPASCDHVRGGRRVRDRRLHVAQIAGDGHESLTASITFHAAVLPPFTLNDSARRHHPTAAASPTRPTGASTGTVVHVRHFGCASSHSASNSYVVTNAPRIRIGNVSITLQNHPCVERSKTRAVVRRKLNRARGTFLSCRQSRHPSPAPARRGAWTPMNHDIRASASGRCSTGVQKAIVDLGKGCADLTGHFGNRFCDVEHVCHRVDGVSRNTSLVPGQIAPGPRVQRRQFTTSQVTPNLPITGAPNTLSVEPNTPPSLVTMWVARRAKASLPASKLQPCPWLSQWQPRRFHRGEAPPEHVYGRDCETRIDVARLAGKALRRHSGRFMHEAHRRKQRLECSLKGERSRLRGWPAYQLSSRVRS